MFCGEEFSLEYPKNSSFYYHAEDWTQDLTQIINFPLIFSPGIP